MEFLRWLEDRLRAEGCPGLLTGHAQDGGIVGRAPVGIREPYPHGFATDVGLDGWDEITARGPCP